MAQEYSVGAGLTTLGPSVEASYALQPDLALRGVLIGGITVDGDTEIDDYTVDGELQLGGLAALLDYYPMQNGLRISGGLFFSTSELDATFTGPETFRGSGEFDSSAAPMITAGYKYDFQNNWSLSGDIGAIITEISFSADTTDPDVQADISDLNDDASELGFYPYLAVAVTYRF